MVPRGEFAIFERKKAIGKPELIKWDPHTSLHSNGRLHMKSYDKPMLVTHVQPPTPSFKGSQSLAQIAGFGPRSVGAVCDPDMFTDVIRIHRLGPRDGAITVDLVEPGQEPGYAAAWRHVDARVVYEHTIPNVVITVGTLAERDGIRLPSTTLDGPAAERLPGGSMATERLSMRKTREILRLKELKRSHREISRVLDVGGATVSEAAARARAAQLD